MVIITSFNTETQNCHETSKTEAHKFVLLSHGFSIETKQKDRKLMIKDNDKTKTNIQVCIFKQKLK
jgi:hypothetical protein